MFQTNNPTTFEKKYPVSRMLCESTGTMGLWTKSLHANMKQVQCLTTWVGVIRLFAYVDGPWRVPHKHCTGSLDQAVPPEHPPPHPPKPDLAIDLNSYSPFPSSQSKSLFSLSYSRPSPFLCLRGCSVWQQQPQWWRGWRPVWIKKQSTTASSAWTLML